METNVDSVCNWIKSIRKSQKRNTFAKCITIQLFKENEKQVSTKLSIIFNKNTENMNFTHCIFYCKRAFFPSVKHNKLKCINKNAIEQYEKNSEYARKNLKSKEINIKLDEYMTLYVYIKYNIKNEHISVYNKVKHKGYYIPR